MSGLMVSIATVILFFKSNQVFRRLVVAQTLCPSRNPVQATDKKSSPLECPARSIDEEELRSTSEERLDKNAGEPHPAV
jgi:hypothetical protein